MSIAFYFLKYCFVGTKNKHFNLFGHRLKNIFLGCHLSFSLVCGFAMQKLYSFMEINVLLFPIMDLNNFLRLLAFFPKLQKYFAICFPSILYKVSFFTFRFVLFEFYYYFLRSSDPILPDFPNFWSIVPKPIIH